MKKETIFFNIFLIILISFGVPVFLLYYYDNLRVSQLNKIQAEVLWAENQKEISVVKEQIMANIEKINSKINELSNEVITKKYDLILQNKIIRNSSYSQKTARKKIADEFLKNSKNFNADLILLYTNGNPLVSNKPELNTLSFSRNNKFLQALPSKKIVKEINFSNGVAEFFIPVVDVKDRLVSVLYVKEDISGLADEIRKKTQSAHGYNIIFDFAGRTLLNTDKSKESTENIFLYPDLKAILTNEISENVKEAVYNNFNGLLGYKKREDMEIIICVFTPYADYSFMRKTKKKYEPVFFDNSFYVPVYAILAGVVFLMLLYASFTSSLPFKPLRKIIYSLNHIDEEGFEEHLPKIKKGYLKKIIDAILILRSRVKASEEKANKLAQMSKELEEELSKEASKADIEISQLRDAIKISETARANFEEENLKLKKEIEKQKSDFEKKLADEKAILNQQIENLKKEIEKFKTELKKAQETTVPAEKENMRMESILMMNTELKGVLSVIKTYISSVLGGEGKITDAQQQFLGVVINKSARLERLINDLTELARLEKGEIKLLRQPMDVNNIIQDAIFSIQPQADIKKIELKTNFSPTLPTCLGDASRLSSVITQLFNQALKVSPRGSKIIVETKEENNKVLIKITDYGMSLPQARANSLFINFHGPESVTSPEFANTGLRFPIIKAIINNMGGDIWIESEIGKGKTFVISLLKSGSEAQTQKEASQPQPNIKQEEQKQQPFKIQRNVMQDVIKESPDKTQNKEQEKSKEPLTVSELLSFDITPKEKIDLPGKEVKVPPELLENKEKKDNKPVEENKKLPDELPPIDLDGKGII